MQQNQPPANVASTAELGHGARPVAWMYEESTHGADDVRGRCWSHKVSLRQPGMPWMLRNVIALYDQAAIDAAVENERARIAASLRLSGAVLPAPEINGTPESGIITGLCIALTLVEDGPN